MKQQLLKIRTKNHTASPLKGIIVSKIRTVFRLGSSTPTNEIFPRGVARGEQILEINTAQSCHNSGNKILMKSLFLENNVKSAEWAILNQNGLTVDWIHYPAIIKHKNSCKGKGIYYVENVAQLMDFMSNNHAENYIIEKYYNYSKEYRLHVTRDGCFYTCRKMLKEDAGERWHRHDTNSVWIMDTNPLFERPSNWDDLVSGCVKALNAVGLTIGACDIKIQTEKGKRADFVPDFIIMEINSAPSFGSVTTERYIEELQKIIANN